MAKIVFFCIPAYGHTNPTIGDSLRDGPGASGAADVIEQKIGVCE